MCVYIYVYIYIYIYIYMYACVYAVSSESENETLYCSNIQQLCTAALYRVAVRHVLRTTDLQCYRKALVETVISLISVSVKQLVRHCGVFCTAM